MWNVEECFEHEISVEFAYIRDQKDRGLLGSQHQVVRPWSSIQGT